MRYAEGRWAQGRWDRQLGRQFSVAGRTNAATTNVNDVHAQLWNPHSVRSLWVLEVETTRVDLVSGVPVLRLVRSSARGSGPGATVTPDLDNDFERGITPGTGAVLEVANFTTEPTLTGAPFGQSMMTAATAGLQAGPMYQWGFPAGLRVPPGTGLCVAVTLAGSGGVQSESIFRFLE